MQVEVEPAAKKKSGIRDREISRSSPVDRLDRPARRHGDPAPAPVVRDARLRRAPCRLAAACEASRGGCAPPADLHGRGDPRRPDQRRDHRYERRARRGDAGCRLDPGRPHHAPDRSARRGQRPLRTPVFGGADEHALRRAAAPSGPRIRAARREEPAAAAPRPVLALRSAGGARSRSLAGGSELRSQCRHLEVHGRGHTPHRPADRRRTGPAPCRPRTHTAGERVLLDPGFRGHPPRPQRRRRPVRDRRPPGRGETSRERAGGDFRLPRRCGNTRRFARAARGLGNDDRRRCPTGRS